MRWSRMIAAVVLTLPGWSPASANVPPAPPPRPKPEAQPKLVVEVDPKAKVARLEVPRKLAPGAAAPAAPGEEGLTDAGSGEGRSLTRTVLAGVSLALAMSCMGLWLARRGKVAGVRVGGLLALAVLTGGAAVGWADIAPPGGGGRPRPRPQPQPRVVVGQIYSGPVAVEYVAEGDTIKLILPPNEANKPGQATGKPAQPE